MPNHNGNRVQPKKSFVHADAPSSPFVGFDAPTSNTTYTPNQFFDVCISRGAVRLVAYMIRKTLGWCDVNGNPQESQITASYNELIENAGIDRSMIRGAIDEALRGNFIRSVQSGARKSIGNPGRPAVFELRWADDEHYVKDPDKFQGFFQGEGNRTYIPNQFFDSVVPIEPLAVTRLWVLSSVFQMPSMSPGLATSF